MKSIGKFKMMILNLRDQTSVGVQTRRFNMAIMDVEYEELDYWGWECPDCKGWNETQDDPAYSTTVQCDNCDTRFYPVPPR